MKVPAFGVKMVAVQRNKRGPGAVNLRHKPSFDCLEERCVLTTYTLPLASFPIVEMVYGPAGDVGFSGLGDLSISRMASKGSVTEVGLPTLTAQPVNLEVDASD